MRFNNVEVNSDTICTIMINEVVLSCSKDDFYGKRNGAEEIGNKVASLCFRAYKSSLRFDL